jgi:hypothetical protein
MSTSAPSSSLALASSTPFAAAFDRLASLPDAARASLWDVIGPALTEHAASVDGRIERFARRHGLEPAVVAEVTRAALAVVRRGVQAGLSRDDFAAWLVGQCPEPRAREVLVSGYEPAKILLERERLRALLAEQGSVVEAVRWRIDTITGASSAERLRQQVALVSFQVRNGARRERVSMQMMPDALRELQKLCARMLPPAPGTKST